MKLFRKQLSQDEKLLKNIEEYEQKEKTKQQESKVLGQKPLKRETNKLASSLITSNSPNLEIFWALAISSLILCATFK